MSFFFFSFRCPLVDLNILVWIPHLLRFLVFPRLEPILIPDVPVRDTQDTQALGNSLLALNICDDI